jgi:hypothetical protein
VTITKSGQSGDVSTLPGVVSKSKDCCTLAFWEGIHLWAWSLNQLGQNYQVTYFRWHFYRMMNARLNLSTCKHVVIILKFCKVLERLWKLCKCLSMRGFKDPWGMWFTSSRDPMKKVCPMCTPLCDYMCPMLIKYSVFHLGPWSPKFRLYAQFGLYYTYLKYGVHWQNGGKSPLLYFYTSPLYNFTKLPKYYDQHTQSGATKRMQNLDVCPLPQGRHW